MDHRSTTHRVFPRLPRLLVSLLLVTSVVLSGPGAGAKDSDVVKETDSCKRTSDVKLKAENAGSGVIQVSAVVFSADDDTWDWKLKHNGDVSYKGSVKAKDSDRSFRIVREMADFAGIDQIGFRAQNNATGEVCSVVIDY